MSYEVVVEALRSKLDEIDGLLVVVEDHKKIQVGTAKAVILRYDGVAQRRSAMAGNNVLTWSIEVNIFCRYVDDAKTRDDMRDVRVAIIDKVNSHTRLGNADGVFDALIMRGDRGLESNRDVQLGNIRYLSERLFCSVEEDLETVDLD